MKKLLSLTSISLAVLLFTSALLTACQKAPEGDWRDEVTSVLSQMEEQRPVHTTTSVSHRPSGNDAPEPGYTNDNVGQLHPISNPDAGVIPSVSYGNTGVLVYRDQVYVPMRDGGNYSSLLHSVNLSDLISYDPASGASGQFVPKATPLCFDPFCQHKTYGQNNGMICSLNFDNRRFESIRNSQPIYCIDYKESSGVSPVFYIVAGESEYKVVGEQVVENVADDYAIYKYNTALGKREIIAENLPDSITSLTICGDYIYYYSSEGLTAIDKTGRQVGNSESAVHILAYENGILYLSDSMGKIYTSGEDLSNLKFVYTVDTSQMDYQAVIHLLQATATPFGYVVEDGYLYFCSNPQVIWTSTVSDRRQYSSSIYRVPLNDLTVTPELIVSDQCYSGFLYGVRDSKLYFVPSINQYGDSDTKWVNARCLAYADLSTKEVTVLEEHAFDMPKCGINETQRPVLTSGFVIGPERQYNTAQSLLALYHFETGDIMYISMSSMYGYTK